MAETNSTPVVDDDKPVTEDDLRALKESMVEVDPPKEEDEPTSEAENEEEAEETSEEDGQTDDQASEEEAPAEPSFVKEFDYIKGDTPEEYAKNLEAAYKNSSSEALRLKGELDATKQAPPVAPTTEAPAETESQTVVDLYVKQKLESDIQTAFDEVKKDYPQASDPTEYAKFTEEVSIFANASLAKGILAPPAELYSKAAISLGWEKKNAAPDDKEKLGMALKDGAASGKTGAAPKPPKAAGPKVSEEMLKVNRKMYPGKTDQEIIDELAAYL